MSDAYSLSALGLPSGSVLFLSLPPPCVNWTASVERNLLYLVAPGCIVKKGRTRRFSIRWSLLSSRSGFLKDIMTHHGFRHIWCVSIYLCLGGACPRWLPGTFHMTLELSWLPCLLVWKVFQVHCAPFLPQIWFQPFLQGPLMFRDWAGARSARCPLCLGFVIEQSWERGISVKVKSMVRPYW